MQRETGTDSTTLTHLESSPCDVILSTDGERRWLAKYISPQDWIKSHDGYNRVAALVNANSPGAVRPRASQELQQYVSPRAAFNEEGSTFDEGVIDLVVAWLQKEATCSSS